MLTDSGAFKNTVWRWWFCITLPRQAMQSDLWQTAFPSTPESKRIVPTLSGFNTVHNPYSNISMYHDTPDKPSFLSPHLFFQFNEMWKSNSSLTGLHCPTHLHCCVSQPWALDDRPIRHYSLPNSFWCHLLLHNLLLHWVISSPLVVYIYMTIHHAWNHRPASPNAGFYHRYASSNVYKTTKCV